MSDTTLDLTNEKAILDRINDLVEDISFLYFTYYPNSADTYTCSSCLESSKANDNHKCASDCRRSKLTQLLFDRDESGKGKEIIDLLEEMFGDSDFQYRHDYDNGPDVIICIGCLEEDPIQGPSRDSKKWHSDDCAAEELRHLINAWHDLQL